MEYGLEYPKLFDWRLRAPSRSRKPPDRPTRGFIKRNQPPNVDVQMDEPFYEAITAYKDRFNPLLTFEQTEAEATLKDRVSGWPLDRLREEGYCLTGVSAFWLQATQFGRPVASFILGPGVVLPDHRFDTGTQVLVSRIDPLQETPIHGSVVANNGTSVNVSFTERYEIDEGVWRLDVGISNLIYDRMRVALARLNHDVRLQEPNFVPNDQETILHGTHLRDVLLRSFSPEHAHLPQMLQAPDDVDYPSHQKLDHGSTVGKGKGGYEHMGAFRDDMRIQSWARRYAEIDPVIVEGDPDLSGLNRTQIRALATMIGQRISLIQGPPGTGKTRTIIEAVKLLKVHFEVPHPVLVCTYTNVAVDNLVEGLVATGVKPLRVGFGEKVRSSLLKHTLDYQIEMHPLQKVLAPIVKEEKKLEGRIRDMASAVSSARASATSDAKAQKQYEKLQIKHASLERQIFAVRRRMYGIEQDMLQSIVKKADVICTTCVSSASAALNVVDFPVVFLDEASMSTEPASLVPLMKGSRHVSLIGDHKQLPPVIQSREAVKGGLGMSLFERLTEESVVPSLMLDIQYRMHPGISRFPATEFYNLSLIDGTIDAFGNVHPHLYPPNSQHLRENGTGHRPPVIFLDHAGIESFKDRSRVNYNEAHIVVSIVEDLLLNNPELQGNGIGIIAPYVAQVSLLTRLLKRDAKHQKRIIEVLGDYRAMQLANIEIKTVDGFEGREKEVIIFSTVRNNTGGHIGFLADRRRLNVGLTRAKRGLFVVGSITTLRAGRRRAAVTQLDGSEVVAKSGKGAESWRRYADFLTAQGLVIRLSGDALNRALYGNLQAARTIATT
ncbi:P-loop containing nucleoside triphosphate hydrolase protein [Amanita rubescens]|nr:P-loop containing nucleoside triphosphate hydrolase protein [Amanita rubescens]